MEFLNSLPVTFLQSLPVYGKLSEIIKATENNSVVVIVAPTGSGKSIAIPVALAKALGLNVCCTQPRIFATHSVTEGAAAAFSEHVGGFIGYRYSGADNTSAQTKVVYMTDGLAVQKLLNDDPEFRRDTILVVDEAHEGSENIATILAVAKRLQDRGEYFRLVVMSATIDKERVSEYFSGAPIIEVEGRMFPVDGSPACGEVRQYGADETIKVIHTAAKAGEKLLVFCPGKGEIEDLRKLLTKGVFSNTGDMLVRPLEADVFALHAELTAEEQMSIHKPAGKRPVVVLATNVAQTSVTIEGVTAVISLGKKREKQLINGVESLVLAECTKADLIQQAGRAGRLREGWFALCSDVPYAERMEHPIGEIRRTLLSNLYLRLDAAGLDPKTLNFYDAPEQKEFERAIKTLKFLGALDSEGHITKYGQKMARLGVDPEHAAMLLEAGKRGVLNAVIKIVAIMGTRNGTIFHRSYMPNAGEPSLRRDAKSDYFAELRVYNTRSRDAIDQKAYADARANEDRIRTALRNAGFDTRFQDNTDEGEILKSMLKGMVEHIYVDQSTRKSTVYANMLTGKVRKPNKYSGVNVNGAGVIIGYPLNIEAKMGGGTVELIQGISIVTPSMLAEVHPLYVKEGGNIATDNDDNFVMPQYFEMETKRVSLPAKKIKISAGAALNMYRYGTNVLTDTAVYKAYATVQELAEYGRGGSKATTLSRETVVANFLAEKGIVLEFSSKAELMAYDWAGISYEEFYAYMCSITGVKEDAFPQTLTINGHEYMVEYANNRIQIAEGPDLHLLPKTYEGVTIVVKSNGGWDYPSNVRSYMMDGLYEQFRKITDIYSPVEKQLATEIIEKKRELQDVLALISQYAVLIEKYRSVQQECGIRDYYAPDYAEVIEWRYLESQENVEYAIQEMLDDQKEKKLFDQQCEQFGQDVLAGKYGQNALDAYTRVIGHCDPICVQTDGLKFLSLDLSELDNEEIGYGRARVNAEIYRMSGGTWRLTNDANDIKHFLLALYENWAQNGKSDETDVDTDDDFKGMATDSPFAGLSKMFK